MLTSTARHFEKKKTLIPKSRQLTRKPPRAALKPLDRPSFPGYGYELIRTFHDGLPYMKGRRATDLKVTIQIRFCWGSEHRFVLLPSEDGLRYIIGLNFKIAFHFLQFLSRT